MIHSNEVPQIPEEPQIPKVPQIHILPVKPLTPNHSVEGLRPALPTGYSDGGGFLVPIGAKGLIVPKPREDLTLEKPTQEQIAKFNQETDEEKEEIEKNARKKNEILLSYYGGPWNYFDARLKAAGIDSPTNEIQKKIKAFREKTPEISQESWLLLKNQNKDTRQAEKDKYLAGGYSLHQLEVAMSSDTALINVIDLDFVKTIANSELQSNGSLDGFYQFLDICIDDLFNLSEPIENNFKHLAGVCKYLDILTNAFLYKSGCYKLDNPELLEKIVSKIEVLTNGEKKHPPAYLQSLFDFLSYFEMNNSNASNALLEISKAHNFYHPIINELDYQLNPKDREDVTQPRIGIEIEGIYTVLFGQVPQGFEIGIDGGGSIPELRKNFDSLHFDKTYKKQLFDLWYFVKMTQLKGASLHIHIDNPNDNLLEVFQRLFGKDLDTIKHSGLGSVEIRLNLSSYQVKENGEVILNPNTPFFHPQYDLTNLIQILIEYGNTQELNTNVLKTVPTFWKYRLSIQPEQQRKKITIEKVMELSKNSGWDSDVIFEALKHLDGSLTIEKVMELSENSGWDSDVIIEALKHLDGSLTIEKVMELSKKSGWNSKVVAEALKHRDRLLTIEKVMELSENSEWNWHVIIEALKHLGGVLTIEKVMELSENSGWDSDVIIEAFNHLGGVLTIEKVMELSENSGWNSYVIIEALKHLDGSLTIEKVMELSKKYGWNSKVITEAFNHLGGVLTIEKVMELSKKYGWNSKVVAEALKHLDGSLTIEKVMELSENSGWNKYVIIEAMKHLDGVLTIEKVMELSKKSGWNSKVITEALKHRDRLLTIEEVMELSENSGWNKYVIIEAMKHLDGSLTINWDLFANYLRKMKNISMIPLVLNRIQFGRAISMSDFAN